MARQMVGCLVAVAFWGCGQGKGPGVTAALSVNSTTGSATDGGASAGRGGQPSAEDIAACSGKIAGAACSDLTDGGDPGACALAADGTTLYCAENHGGAGHGGPSAEDIASCTGKSVNATCTDVVDGGNPGTCQLAPDGVTLACCEQR